MDGMRTCDRCGRELAQNCPEGNGNCPDYGRWCVERLEEGEFTLGTIDSVGGALQAVDALVAQCETYSAYPR